MNLVKQLTKNRASVEPETVVTTSLLLGAACQAVAITSSSNEPVDVFGDDSTPEIESPSLCMLGPCKPMDPASELAGRYRRELQSMISKYLEECCSAGFEDLQVEFEPENSSAINVYQRATTRCGETVASSEYTRPKSRDSRMILFPDKSSSELKVGRIEAFLQVEHASKPGSNMKLALVTPMMDSKQHDDRDLGTMYTASEPPASARLYLFRCPHCRAHCVTPALIRAPRRSYLGNLRT